MLINFLRYILRKTSIFSTLQHSAQGKPSVGWILFGDMQVGSSRIHGINIHDCLVRKGIRSEILQSNDHMNPCLTISAENQERILSSDVDILIFQKVYDDRAIEFAKTAKKRGIKTVFLLSDLIDCEMINVVDCLVVTSFFLKTVIDHRYNCNAIVIDDAVENKENLFKVTESKASLQLVWVGHKDNWEALSIVNSVLCKMKDSSFTLKTISNHPKSDVIWRLDTVNQEILSGDIAVIPTLDTDWAMSKSNNRLTMFMSLGLPVIASRIPVYKSIIDHGVNGFLVKSECEWQDCLNKLKDAKLRKQISIRAKKDVQPYCIDSICEKWLLLFQSMTEYACTCSQLKI